MGMIADKAIFNGIFGGFTTSKTGKHFLSVIEQGPKINKISLDSPPDGLNGLTFGQPIKALCVECEQKFQDFNGSYSAAKSCTIQPVK